MTPSIPRDPELAPSTAPDPLSREPLVYVTGNLEHFSFIDALRGLAFLLVIACHTADLAGVHEGTLLGAIITLGRAGVQLFYVISAFTLIHSIHSRRRSEARPTLNFFIRRFFRIAPLFWTMIFFYSWFDARRYFLLQAWAPGGIHWQHVLMTIFMVHAWYPTTINSVVPGGWSVGVEMSFYLLVPFLVAHLRNWMHAAWAIVGSLLLSACLIVIVEKLFFLHGAGPLFSPYRSNALAARFLTFWLPSQLPVFLTGFLLYFLCVGDPAIVKSGINPAGQPKALCFLILGLVVLAVNCLIPANVLLPPPFIFGLGFAMIVRALAIYPWKVVVNPVFCYIGKISYSCYLLHVFVVYVVMRYPLHRVGPLLLGSSHFFPTAGALLLLLLCYGVGVGLTLAMAHFSFRYVEQPGMLLGKRLIAMLNKRISPARA